jgi:uncharacterized protein YcbK (DUF882 family)
MTSKLVRHAGLFVAATIVGLAAIPEPAAAVSTGCLPSVLKSRLSSIRSMFGPVTVVSAHRPGARIRGSGKPSYHGSCRAVDFVPPSGKYDRVVRWLYANHEGGVGTYTCMNHIHIDNGPSVRFSKCR